MAEAFGAGLTLQQLLALALAAAFAGAVSLADLLHNAALARPDGPARGGWRE